jgi:predicted N-acetyltransferase YhbS
MSLLLQFSRPCRLTSRVVSAVGATVTDEGFYVDNVAVRPSVKGRGVGRQLLEFAEAAARRRGHSSIYLATRELMVENRARYTRIGYVECDQRVVNGQPVQSSGQRTARPNERTLGVEETMAELVPAQSKRRTNG